mmetsp:Transcript_108021/g.344904  ORF Transcript_108021/g.344904 Transcript_108021/m.344904 type:complete len:283 (+) Transcript_108021:1012-1860(+)
MPGQTRIGGARSTRTPRLRRRRVLQSLLRPSRQRPQPQPARPPQLLGRKRPRPRPPQQRRQWPLRRPAPSRARPRGPRRHQRRRRRAAAGSRRRRPPQSLPPRPSPLPPVPRWKQQPQRVERTLQLRARRHLEARESLQQAQQQNSAPPPSPHQPRSRMSASCARSAKAMRPRLGRRNTTHLSRWRKAKKEAPVRRQSAQSGRELWCGFRQWSPRPITVSWRCALLSPSPSRRVLCCVEQLATATWHITPSLGAAEAPFVPESGIAPSLCVHLQSGSKPVLL